jgi:peptide/nickel transport system substrate-binding protein
MKPRKQKLIFIATVCALLLSTLAYAQEMTVGVANLLKYLDPGQDHSNVGSQIYHNSFDSLIHKDPTRVEPAFLPGLAVSWQMIAPTCMELQLRRDVTFHNGDPMTADDVVFSLMRMFIPSYPPYVIRQREYFMNMYKAEKVDEYTVRVFTKRPDPLFEILLAV